MKAEPNRQTVYIVKAHGQILVRPSWVMLRDGDNDIEVHNHSGENVDLVVPPTLFIPGVSEESARSVEAGEAKVIRLPLTSKASPGAHAYGFYGKDSREFAVGDSSPIFIVDR